MTLLLHPDKNPASLREMALNAFRDIVSAYEVIGTPKKGLHLMIMGQPIKKMEDFKHFGNTNKVEKKIRVIFIAIINL